MRHKAFKGEVISVRDQKPQVNWAGIRLHHKLKSLKISLNEWSKSFFGNVSYAKNDLLANIQYLDNKESEEGLTDQGRSDWSWLKEELIEVTVREEINWRQKSRLKWLTKEITTPSSSTLLPMPVGPTTIFRP